MHKLCHGPSYTLIRSVKNNAFETLSQFYSMCQFCGWHEEIVFKFILHSYSKEFSNQTSFRRPLFFWGIGKMQSNTLSGVHCTV